MLSHLFFAAIIKRKKFNSQKIAVVIQCSEDFINDLITLVSFYSNLEVTMIGLERCETVTKIQIEKDSEDISNFKLTNFSTWPKEGRIKFINYYTRYRPDTPMVLKKINFEFQPGDKIGIVGRTGSGKSSLLLAMARIIESSGGKIIIDGVDIASMNLNKLRQNLSIVPQDTFIIEGSVKDNIDPLHIYPDSEIIKIINDFCLFKEMKNDREKLMFEIKENGINLSIGQKQLICFARALIKNNKIILLDEATSSLDIETEKIIQKNMHKYFGGATVILIAHHIQMVKDCKHIIVIDKGEIVESGTYQKLLQDKTSFFYSLYSESLVS